MLSRVLTFSVGCVVLLVACKPSSESKLVGKWQTASAEGAGKVRFDADHTFMGAELSLERVFDLPIIDKGEWHVRGSKLVLNFEGAHNPKRSELVLTVRDDDHIVLRQPSGLEIKLERLK
jgi:hypothetical protein